MGNMWRDRHNLIAPEHAPELEARAAIHELTGGMHPVQAENQAYADYVASHMARSAAHHLAGIRAAHAAGDNVNATKHAMMYGILMRTLGHDPNGEPPADIAALSKDPMHTSVYNYKPHGADVVVLEHIRKLKNPGLHKSESYLHHNLIKTIGDTQVWDVTHLLSPDRQAKGEKLHLQQMGNNKSVHHFTEVGGSRKSIGSAVFSDKGPRIMGLHPDVVDSATKAVDMHRAIDKKGVIDSGRALLSTLGAVRASLKA